MRQRFFHSQLRINMASGMITAVINAGILAISYPIYLHFLGHEQYGLWLALSVVLTFAQFGNLGIGPAVTKFVAEDYGRGDIEGIQHYVTTAIALLCLSGTIILVLILILKRQIVALFGLSDENARKALWLIPYIGVLSTYVLIIQVFKATLSGLGRMDPGLAPKN
ncbi:MAG: lipopolysaccharide biosynthesis protein [Planctomycetota bacterium]|jgi:O-antigen/teichoic acid export membrane protein